MKIHPGVIGFDIDGVVADTATAFIRLAREEYGLDTLSSADITEFEVEECLDVDPAVVDRIFATLMEEPVAAGLQPMEHAVDVLRKFAGVAPLTFITARPLRRPIEEWLQNVLGPDICGRTRLVAMGGHDKKGDYIKGMGLEYFIDDRAQTCIALHKEGITPVVYSQPWNRGKHNLRTVDNWLDIRDLCFDE